MKFILNCNGDDFLYTNAQDENAADVAMFKFLLINLLCTILLEKGTSSGQFLLIHCDKQNDAMVAKLNKMNGKQCPPVTECNYL